MDLDVKAPPKDDEEIIDLTDIIEKGPQAKSAPESLDDSIDDLVSDLGNSGTSNLDIPSDAEADIDALLAQMDAGVDITAAPAPSSSTAPDVSLEPTPDLESPEDDLPDTSDVDALLESMDMPPQPDPAKAAPKEVNDSASDMDALLESILDGSSDKNPSPTKVEDAPAASPKPSTSADDLSDLDAMIEDITGQAGPSEEKAPTPPADDLSDLDAMLEDITGQAEPSEETAPTPPADDLSDLDAMLEDIVAEVAQPVSDAHDSAVQTDSNVQEPKVDTAADSEEILNDLDELLRSVDDEDKVQVASADTEDDVDFSDLDQALDESGFDEMSVQVDDIAESLLPGGKTSKGTESLSANIMDAVDAISENIDFIPDSVETSDLDDEISADIDDILESGPEPESELEPELDLEPELELELELEPEPEPEPEPEQELEQEPELDLEPELEPEPELIPEPESELEMDMAEEILVDDSQGVEPPLNPVARSMPVPDLGAVHTAGSRVEAMESLHKVQSEQEDLVKRVEYLEERVIHLEGIIVELEEKFTKDLESMAAKAAAKIIREEIAALLSGE